MSHVTNSSTPVPATAPHLYRETAQCRIIAQNEQGVYAVEVPSKSTADSYVMYVWFDRGWHVRHQNGDTCPGFEYRGKCRHIALALDTVMTHEAGARAVSAARAFMDAKPSRAEIVQEV
jgi:hypothetical protein